MISRRSLLASGVLALGACQRKHISVASVPEIPYPSCPSGDLTTAVLGAGYLRAGENSLEGSVVEHFEVRRRGCHYVATTRQEWPLNVADVELVFDLSWVPLRAWKRMTLPGVQRNDGLADIRRYELRGPEVTIKKRGSDRVLRYEILRGPRPQAIIGPGRGLLTAWLQKARLQPDQRQRIPVLDLRAAVETLRMVTLKRERDLFQEWAGRSLRVYTIYGREAVLADENDVVVGDLAGLRPHSSLRTPAPPELPSYGPPDPINTP